MAKNKSRLEQHLQKVEDFIRSRAQGISPTVRGFPTLKGLGRMLGDMELEDKEAHAFQEILDFLSPDDGITIRHSRAVVDNWLQECVLSALDDKSSAMSLDERIDSAIKQLRNRLQSPLLKWEF